MPQAGEECSSDGTCAKNLSCISSTTITTSRCFDSSGIGAGGACSPSGPLNGKLCGTIGSAPQNPVPGPGLQPLTCLPKGDGFGCQLARSLFETCSVEKNQACIQGLVCSDKLSLCVLPS